MTPNLKSQFDINFNKHCDLLTLISIKNRDVHLNNIIHNNNLINYMTWFSSFLLNVGLIMSIHVSWGQVRDPKATLLFVWHVVKHKFVDHPQMNCKPKEILSYMEKDFRVFMTYKKVWRAKEKAIGLLYETDTE